MPEEPTIRDEQIREDLDRKKAASEEIRQKFLQQVANAQTIPKERDDKGRYFSSENPPKKIEAERPKIKTATGEKAEQEIRWELRFRKPWRKGRDAPGQGMGLPQAWLRASHRKNPRKTKRKPELTDKA